LYKKKKKKNHSPPRHLTHNLDLSVPHRLVNHCLLRGCALVAIMTYARTCFIVHEQGSIATHTAYRNPAPRGPTALLLCPYRWETLTPRSRCDYLLILARRTDICADLGYTESQFLGWDSQCGIRSVGHGRNSSPALSPRPGSRITAVYLATSPRTAGKKKKMGGRRSSLKECKCSSQHMHSGMVLVINGHIPNLFSGTIRFNETQASSAGSVPA